MKAMLSALFLAMGSEASVAQSDIWRATGDAATAVTGDIRIEHDRIVFANGSGLALVPIEERVGVFKVDPPANPALMDGSRLCGDRNITFVTLAQGVDRSLFMKVFDEPSPPIEAFGNLLPQEGACGMYSFSQ